VCGRLLPLLLQAMLKEQQLKWDTNICIFYLKGRFNLNTKIEPVGFENCFVSEMTVAELKFGVENSEHVEKNRKENASKRHLSTRR
jgi:predicted nucleic acid-binding protein